MKYVHARIINFVTTIMYCIILHNYVFGLHVIVYLLSILILNFRPPLNGTEAFHCLIKKLNVFKVVCATQLFYKMFYEIDLLV